MLLLFFSVEKRFYSVENLVEKAVGEQDKTHEFSICVPIQKELRNYGNAPSRNTFTKQHFKSQKGEQPY